MCQRDGIELSQAILGTITERIQLNSSVKTNLEIIIIESQAGGNARTKLLSETRTINEEFTERLRQFVQSLKPNHKPNNKPPHKKPYARKTTKEETNNSGVNKELSKLVRKLEKK